MPVVDSQQCDAQLGPGLVTENMICAGFQEGGIGPCQVNIVSYMQYVLYNIDYFSHVDPIFSPFPVCQLMSEIGH